MALCTWSSRSQQKETGHIAQNVVWPSEVCEKPINTINPVAWPMSHKIIWAIKPYLLNLFLGMSITHLTMLFRGEPPGFYRTQSNRDQICIYTHMFRYKNLVSVVVDNSRPQKHQLNAFHTYMQTWEHDGKATSKSAGSVSGRSSSEGSAFAIATASAAEIDTRSFAALRFNPIVPTGKTQNTTNQAERNGGTCLEYDQRGECEQHD